MSTTATHVGFNYVLYHDSKKPQLDRVYSVLADHAVDRPLTLEAISSFTGIPASSVASRIRDIRAQGLEIRKERIVGATKRTFSYVLVA